MSESSTRTSPDGISAVSRLTFRLPFSPGFRSPKGATLACGVSVSTLWIRKVDLPRLDIPKTASTVVPFLTFPISKVLTSAIGWEPLSLSSLLQDEKSSFVTVNMPTFSDPAPRRGFGCAFTFKASSLEEAVAGDATTALYTFPSTTGVA